MFSLDTLWLVPLSTVWHIRSFIGGLSS